MPDIKKEVIKIIYGEKWKFSFKESGWVVLSASTVDKDNNIKWQTYIQAIDLESCLQYVFSYNRSRGEFLVFDELEDA